MTGQPIKVHKALLVNWLGGLVSVFAAYILFLLWIYLRDTRKLPLDLQLESWWEAGGFFPVITLALGYGLLQTMARGHVTVRQFWRYGVWLLLIPFLLLGSCAGQGYQACQALGGFGQGSQQKVVTLGKVAYEEQALVRTSDNDAEIETWKEYRIIADVPSLDQWELPSGKVVYGGGIPVSEATFDAHRVGSRVSVVELPGEWRTPYRLTDDVKAGLRDNVLTVLFWLVLSVLALWSWSKHLRGLPENHPMVQYRQSMTPNGRG